MQPLFLLLSTFLVMTTTMTTSGNSSSSGVVMALSQDVCIETAPNEDFICTRQVLEIREMYDRQSIDVGVTQRVDGAEVEKEAIRDVLHQMDMYFFTEVLALPEYSYARSRCKNANELCAFWTSVGECESNRVFMMTNCPAACRFCLLLHSGLA